MHIRGREVSAHEGPLGTSVRNRYTLSETDYKELLELLRPVDGKWEERLASTQAIDFTVEILGHSKSIKARKAAGVGTADKEFGRVEERLGVLHWRAMHEGRRVKDTE
jgi:hypothetical protein